MLLVSPPNRDVLLGVVEGLLDGTYSREEVVSWQRAVASEVAWDLPITVANGYWYFYSLAYLTMPFDTGFFIRTQDLIAYVADMRQLPSSVQFGEAKHVRPHALPMSFVQKPLAILPDESRWFDVTPGVSMRGVFEARQDLVEHAHFSFRGATFLLLRQFDEPTRQIYVLGDDRDPDKRDQLLNTLGLVQGTRVT